MWDEDINWETIYPTKADRIKILYQFDQLIEQLNQQVNQQNPFTLDDHCFDETLLLMCNQVIKDLRIPIDNEMFFSEWFFANNDIYLIQDLKKLLKSLGGKPAMDDFDIITAYQEQGYFMIVMSNYNEAYRPINRQDITKFREYLHNELFESTYSTHLDALD